MIDLAIVVFNTFLLGMWVGVALVSYMVVGKVKVRLFGLVGILILVVLLIMSIIDLVLILRG